MPIDAAEPPLDAAEQNGQNAQNGTPGNGNSAVLDLDFVVGLPLFGIAALLSSLETGSDGYLHVLVSATSSADGSAVDLTADAVSVAITTSAPQSADYTPGDWLTRTVAPVGSYARLAVGPSVGRIFAPGAYRVVVSVTATGKTFLLPVPGTINILA